MRRITAGIALLLLAVSQSCFALTPQAKDGKSNSYEPRAIQLLQEMADAYAHLRALRQETEFTSAIMPLVPLPARVTAPAETGGGEERAAGKPEPNGLLNAEHKLDRKLRLAFSAPNKLRLEVEDTDENGKLQTSCWVSDGKTFWTFNPEKNLFSREKAPRKIQEFARLAHMTSGSLEVLMLMGVNPFDHVEQQAEAVRYVGKETVRGIATEVVAMAADLGPQATETRLYIGAEDRLLYRLVSETSQKAQAPGRTGVGSPLDELAPPSSAPPPPPVGADGPPVLLGVLMKSRVICDNKIESEPRFDFTAFTYQPPADALYLTNPDPHKPPMTLKQRIAELNRAARKQKKPRPKIYRY